MGKGFLYILLLVLIGAGVFFGMYRRNHAFADAWEDTREISSFPTEESGISSDMIRELVTSPLPDSSSVPVAANGAGSGQKNNWKRAVVGKDEEIRAEEFTGNTYAAIMVNNTTGECIVAHNVHKRIYPASMTKLMTGMVVCDAIAEGKIALDDVVTVPRSITFRDSDAVSSYLSPGDKITVRNMLYALMLSSYNDYALILAETIAGSEEAFADLMNEKARSIGATCTHFVNPHGLDELDHYTTAYDMYLIVNAAASYDILRDVDTYRTYSYTWTDSAGDVWEDTAEPTNRYLNGLAELPSNIVIGTWKTGTTGGAGHCLTMEVRINGRSYTMLVADSISHDDLYHCFSILFNYAN